MSVDPIELPIYLSLVTGGFLIRFVFDRYSKHKDALRLEAWKIEVETLEKKLSEFYWPIYCRLKRGSIAWKSNNFRDNNSDDDQAKLAVSFDREVILVNHAETRDIIQENFHHFDGDKKLEAALIELLHHIDVYLSLRSAGLNQDPIWVGKRWSNAAEELIAKKVHKLQKRYDSLLANAGSII